MEGINEVMKETRLERKVKLINSIAMLVMKSDKYTQQRWDYNARHLVFNDKFNNVYGVRLVQNTKDNNYEVAIAIQSGGQHMGVTKLKSRKEFVEFMVSIEMKSLAMLRALEKMKQWLKYHYTIIDAS